MNDVEEKYYADGENAYDMRKHFKQSASKSTFPAKQSKPVTDKASETAADKATEKASDASEQSSDAQAAPPAQEKASEPQTENGVADSEKENSNNGGPVEVKASQGKGKSARSKKR